MRKLIIIGSMIFMMGFSQATDFIYFGLSTCPHCVKVDKFLGENKFYEKFDIQKKELSETDIQKLLFDYCNKLDIINICGSVPMLVIDDEGTLSYNMGDANIIEYFGKLNKSQAGIIADRLNESKISKINKYLSDLIKKSKDKSDKLNQIYVKMTSEKNNFRYAELLIKIIDIYKS